MKFNKILELPPVFIKSFLQGFFDKNYISLSQDFPRFNAGIQKSLLSVEIIDLMKKVGLGVNDVISNVDESFFNVRRGFINNNQLMIINSQKFYFLELFLVQHLKFYIF